MPATHLRAVPDVSEGAVLYIRQSVTRYVRDAQGNKTPKLDTVSPELQETAGRDYCARRGYRVVAIVTDLNRTGRTLRRRKVQEAIGHIERGDAAVIVVWKWSRMSRNRRDWAVTCDHIEGQVGGRIESSTEPVDVTTAVGRLNRGMLAEFAAFESDRAGEVFMEIADGRVARGLPGSGRVRFGYTNVGKGRFEPHPELGQVLAEMYQRFAGGSGYRGIARWLNQSGYRTTAGGIWREETVRSVLDSGFGAGLFRHRGKLLPGSHAPVITPGQWQTYLGLRDERKVIPSRGKGSRYVLTGLVKCGVCGMSMHARPDAQGTVWYRCRDRTMAGCPNPLARLTAVEGEVRKWLAELVDEIDPLAEAAQAVQAKVARQQRRSGTVAKLLAQQERALAQLTVERARGWVPDDDAYTAARDEITAERDRLRAEHAELLRGQGAAARLETPVYRRLLDDWSTIPVENRREALRHLLARVRVWGRPLRVQPVPAWEADDVPVRDEHPQVEACRPGQHGGRALTVEQAGEVRRRHAGGESQQALAAEYGVSSSTVSKIVRGWSYRRN
jgi:DNA invertase Pin-like site-specific DNA recombinase